MKVTVEYSAQLRKTTGRAVEELDLEADTTVQQAVTAIAKREGHPLEGLMLGEKGRPSASILLCVNDEQVFWSAPRTLEDGDTITITTPIAGGSSGSGVSGREGTRAREPVSESRHRLTDEERAVYEWQIWTPDFGEAGQERLKGASVLVSRCGGLGSVVAYELAAAGVGRLVIAHAGNVKPSDLNRQLLMTHEGLGKSRVESAKRRLRELNPRLEVVPVPENVSEENAGRLVGEVDLVVDCAPLFEERFLMNREAVRQGKPMVECAMYELEAHITTIRPGKTPCLSCLFPEKPPAWKREFPVFGAVSGSVGCLGAMEAIKTIADFGEPLHGRLLTCDLRSMRFRRVKIRRDPECAVCGSGAT